VHPAAAVTARECVAIALHETVQTAGDLITFRLEARDVFGNEKVFAPDLFYVETLGLAPTQDKAGRIERAAGDKP